MRVNKTTSIVFAVGLSAIRSWILRLSPLLIGVLCQSSPDAADVSNQPAAELKRSRPDPARVHEYLEQFPLQSLHFVATLELSGKTYALVQTEVRLVHRVLPGNYMGQRDGIVTEVTAKIIKLRELIPDGSDGYKAQVLSYSGLRS